MSRLGHSLNNILSLAAQLKEVRKADLKSGDLLFIKTQNSIYAITVLGQASYRVVGGWFDKHGLSPLTVHINGCTWGGSIIKVDIVAACGLCLEFSNGVVTSPIQKIIFIPSESLN
ncbi:MAG: hypothetical protein ONB16_06620 [candidate division KSB1 bacterium]|nr:hypothetical protein [candidate division KSB1 bacterium]